MIKDFTWKCERFYSDSNDWQLTGGCFPAHRGRSYGGLDRVWRRGFARFPCRPDHAPNSGLLRIRNGKG